MTSTGFLLRELCHPRQRRSRWPLRRGHPGERTCMHPVSLVGRCSCALWLQDGLTYLRQRRMWLHTTHREILFSRHITRPLSASMPPTSMASNVARRQLLFSPKTRCILSKPSGTDEKSPKPHRLCTVDNKKFPTAASIRVTCRTRKPTSRIIRPITIPGKRIVIRFLCLGKL
jgi:hypothetical protein